MKKLLFERTVVIAALAFDVVAFAGCRTAGGAAADLGLSSAGGVVGYKVTDGKVGGAVVGAAVGYAASKIAQAEVKSAMRDAEQRGYDRAMNQAVKQQYWILQNQQRSRENTFETEPRLMPVVIPETKINGVIQNAHIEYLRVES